MESEGRGAGLGGVIILFYFIVFALLATYDCSCLGGLWTQASIPPPPPVQPWVFTPYWVQLFRSLSTFIGICLLTRRAFRNRRRQQQKNAYFRDI